MRWKEAIRWTIKWMTNSLLESEAPSYQPSIFPSICPRSFHFCFVHPGAASAAALFPFTRTVTEWDVLCLVDPSFISVIQKDSFEPGHSLFGWSKVHCVRHAGIQYCVCSSWIVTKLAWKHPCRWNTPLTLETELTFILVCLLSVPNWSCCCMWDHLQLWSNGCHTDCT